MPNEGLSRVLSHLAGMERPNAIADRRRIYDALFAGFETAADVQVQRQAAPVAGEWLIAPGADTIRAVLYMHGGGYVRGSMASHRHMVAELARVAGCPVFHVDYRLAPEHPFPAAVEDTVAAYEAVLASGIRPDRIVLAGDSAGGGLVVAGMLMMRERGVPLPAGGWSLSGWFDMEATGESMISQAEVDPYVRREFILNLAREYVQDGDHKHPLAAPIHADLMGLPPLLLQVGSAETLVDDSVALARRAGLAGVLSTLEIWPGMPHVWHMFAPWIPEAGEALASGGRFVRRITAEY